MAIVILTALASLPVLAKTAVAKPDSTRRVVLPSAVSPQHYRIDLVPNAEGLTFTATVAIDVTVHQATERIVLNSADLVIDSAAVSGEPAPPAVTYDTKNETASFEWGHKLKPGAYTLSLAYHGKIYQQTSGLFALDYDTAKGKARALFTKFENADARRFVPCWDEPGRKATYALTATVPADVMPLSNMPVASTEALPGGLKRVHFAVSPKMSSYLLFFGMGDLERVSRDVGGVDVGVVVKRGDTAFAAFALDAAAQILPYYNEYFGTPYPLPKLDLIAGPGSSQRFGAMENWGAIFYLERNLLIDPRISTEADRQRVYIVVAHEMAHMWFGDLVTMAWWDDLWLNEGFASWMEYKVTDRFHPEWKIWLQTLMQKQAAMGVDARDGTHPIITPIDDVMQANGAFDIITYTKGAAVIRTLESYLGEEAFRAGVRRYMRDYAYGNTVTGDLWKAIDKGSPRPIASIAHDLTLQAGVPMVSEVSARCGHGNTTLKLAQGHFAIDADSTTARVWQLPVTVAAIGGAPSKTVVAGARPKSLEVAGCGPVILNAGQTAYFRSRYTSDGLAAVSARFAALSPYDQLGVFYDASSLAFVGEIPIAAMLDLTRNFPADADPVVVSALVVLLRGIDHIYDGLPAQAAFRDYAGKVLAPIFVRTGWGKNPGESDNIAVLRAGLLAALGDFGDPAVIAEARQRYQRFVADAASLDAGTRRTVLGIVALHADQATWDQLHGMAKTAKTQLERQEFYSLLGAAEDKTLAQQALDLAMSGEPPATITPQMINAVSARHPELAFDFTVARWDKFLTLLEPNIQARYVPRLINNASDLKLIAKLDHFAELHIPPGARQDLRKIEANVRYFAKIRQDRLPEVDIWLSKQHG